MLIASIGLVRVGFGMDWYRTLHGAWLVLRANQLWAPYPGNDPEGAQARMRRFYTLVALTHGEPASPARAAELEVTWWRVHREGQHAADGAEPAEDRAMFEELGLNVARQDDNGANPRPDNRSGWLEGESPATPTLHHSERSRRASRKIGIAASAKSSAFATL